MVGEKELTYLKALEKALLTKYLPSSFRIGGYGEENICLNKDKDEWVVSQYEREKNNILGRYPSILDACLAFIDEMTGSEAAVELKEQLVASITLSDELPRANKSLPITVQRVHSKKNI